MQRHNAQLTQIIRPEITINYLKYTQSALSSFKIIKVLHYMKITTYLFGKLNKNNRNSNIANKRHLQLLCWYYKIIHAFADYLRQC